MTTDVPAGFNPSERSAPLQVERPKKEDVIEFDVARAARFAKLCNLPYYVPSTSGNKQNNSIERKTSELTALAEKLKYKVVEQFDAGNMHAVIVANDNGLVVAFRGSNKTFKEGVRGLNSYERCGGPLEGLVNKALYDTLHQSLTGREGESLQQAIFKTIHEYLEAQPEPKPKLYFTGHSVGGSLACMCAAGWMQSTEVPVEAIYTYGQPRVGDEKFAKALEEHPNLRDQHYRIVTSRDPVPVVPGKYAPGRNIKIQDEEIPVYKHSGQPIIIDTTTLEMIAQSSTRTLEDRPDTANLAPYTQLYWNPMLWSKFSQHTIQSYITALDKILEQQMSEQQMSNESHVDRLKAGAGSARTQSR